jgi:starvation-inducible DNA-binding protein
MTSPARIHSVLGDPARKATGDLLQEALIDLVDLSLLAKQAHWTVTGARFRPLHLQLDEIVDAARRFADTVAERAAAIGVAPDGRAATIAACTVLPQPEPGWQPDDAVVAQFVGAYTLLITRMRQRINQAGQDDAVTQDLFIQITGELEKQYWMFQAEQTA